MTENGEIRRKRQTTTEAVIQPSEIDVLPFMRRTGPHQTLMAKPAGKEVQWQSYVEGYDGRFYYVKNVVRRGGVRRTLQYERYGWNDHSIWMERDTSWPPEDRPGHNNAYDARPYGRREWAARPARIGSRVEIPVVEIWPFVTPDQPDGPYCTYELKHRRDDAESREVLYQRRHLGGQINPDIHDTLECVGIKQYDRNGRAVEIFWYAREWGWVEWENLVDPTKSVVWNSYEADSGPLLPEWSCDLLGQDPGTYRAEYYFYYDGGPQPEAPPRLSVYTTTYEVMVRNTGAEPWRAADNMYLTIDLTKLFGSNRKRFAVRLDQDLPVGEVATLNVEIPQPATGLYSIRHTMYRGSTAFAQVTRSFTQMPAVLIASKVQLVFAIDTTGSMGEEIAAVKAAARDVAQVLAPRGVEVAVVEYRDFPEAPFGDAGDYPYLDVLPFSASETDIVAGIDGLTLGGGNDWPEAVYSGLMHVIDGHSLGGWVAGARRFVIVIGDAPAHDPEPFTGYTAQTVIDAAGWGAPAASDVGESLAAPATDLERLTIHSIVVGNDPDALACFTRLSEGTHGRVFPAEGADEVVKAILDALDEVVPKLTIGDTYRVGVADSHAFYRTNILQQSAAFTCRHAQISPAVYHEERNRTYFAYTAGLDGADSEGRVFTAENPWIVAFDHSKGRWEGPVQVGDVRPPSPRRDCHDYPQILIDSQGYLHVFHTFHMTGPNIAHFKSQAPHDITGPWSRSAIPDTSGNTYGAAFKSKEGHFYVFYRDTVWHQPASAGVAESWYEPEMYVKSMDNGRTWSKPRLLIDPGRPRASDASDRARQVTSLINDNGWNTIYVSNLLQDVSRNRLLIDFTATSQHQEQWGNRLMVAFDMYHDEVLTMKGTSLGSRIERPEYLEDDGEGVRVYTGRFITRYMNAYGHALTQAIAVEDDDHGYPTLYYVRFESNKPWLGPDQEDFYKAGWSRLRRARWTGSRWADDYVSGVADPAADPFIQYDELTKQRRETSHIWAAERRGEDGTFLYVKTKWGGVPFWLYPNGARRPDYDWAAVYDYQYPGRVFSTAWPFTTHVRMFGDHHPWEVRGIANFSLVPGGHPTIKAFMRVPKYTKLTPTTGGAGVLGQYAIGADYVWGEEPLQPLRPDREPPGAESRRDDPS